MKFYLRLQFLFVAVTGMVMAFLGSGCQIKMKDELIISGHPNSPPIMWREKNSIKGVGAELAEIIFAEQNIPVKNEYAGDWREVLQKAEDGKIDLIVGLFKQTDRMRYLDYSIAYAEVPVVIVVKRSRTFTFNKWSDLIGKKGTMNTGESWGREFDEYLKKKLQIQELPVEQGFQALVDEKVDYMVISLFPAEIKSRKYGVQNQIEILQKPVTTQNYYMAFSKKSKFTNLLPKVNEKLKELTGNGRVNKLLDRNMILWYKRNRSIDE
jgi:polar amino acid transport system substrate-binding protein